MNIIKKILFALIITYTLSLLFIPKVRFITGAVAINMGYFFQDEASDIHNTQTPEQILNSLFNRNLYASLVRKIFPRTHKHPTVALVSCMDGRIHTEELVGDTQENYYVVRTAGSVLELPEIEMLELAVSNGVKVVLFTTHSDCAAEKVSKDLDKSKTFPELSKAVLRRDQRFQEFLQRPLIKDKIDKKELIVKWAHLDTLGGGQLSM
jgi:hypothetical protein